MIFLLALLVTASAVGKIGGDHDLFPVYLKWHKAYHNQTKVTISEERFKVFCQNYRLIQKHQERFEAGQESFSVALNQFADVSHEEFKAQYLNLQRPSREFKLAKASTQLPTRVFSPPPASWDWRDHGVVNPVKDQGACGSCWAFSAVAAMEGRFASDSGKLVAFSEQELVDCTLDGENTCQQGGEMSDGVLEIVNNHGGEIDTEEQYPYTARSYRRCNAVVGGVDTGITGYQNITLGNEADMKVWASRAVLSIAIDASSPQFQFYAKGVYRPRSCLNGWTELDHGVSVVGYDTDEDGQDFWWVRNSWGPNWGLGGYVKMVRDSEKSSGWENLCGVATDTIYATSPSFP